MRTSQSPLKAIFTLQKSEVPLALLMFSYFFLVITSFWILKPTPFGRPLDASCRRPP